VGGGFLGSELACALAHNAKKHGGKVTQVFPETGKQSFKNHKRNRKDPKKDLSKFSKEISEKFYPSI
jgi:hypothetical protein